MTAQIIQHKSTSLAREVNVKGNLLHVTSHHMHVQLSDAAMCTDHTDRPPHLQSLEDIKR